MDAHREGMYAVVDLREVDFVLAGAEGNDATHGRIRLDAGQHRRAAILKMNGLLPSAREGIFKSNDLENPLPKVQCFLPSVLSNQWHREPPPRVFFEVLDGLDKWFERVLGDHKLFVEPIDTQHLIDIGPDHTINDSLRPLFFSKFDKDFSSSSGRKDGGGGPQVVKGELFRLNAKDLIDTKRNNEPPAWPKLHGVEGRNYEFRRPGFRDRLDDQQYVALYKRLIELKVSDLEFPPWDWVIKKDVAGVSETVNLLLKHVLSWFAPNEILPSKDDGPCNQVDVGRDVQGPMCFEIGSSIALLCQRAMT